MCHPYDLYDHLNNCIMTGSTNVLLLLIYCCYLYTNVLHVTVICYYWAFTQSATCNNTNDVMFKTIKVLS